MGKSRNILKIELGIASKEDTDLLVDYFDRQPLGKILLPDVILLIKKRVAEVPETFKMVRSKK